MIISFCKLYNHLGRGVFTSVACCQLDLSCLLIPWTFYAYIILLFWVTVSCCLVPRILVAAGLIVYMSWRFNLMFRDPISTSSSCAKPLPFNLFYFWTWCGFLESLAKCTPLGPSLLGRGPEDRFPGQFPSPEKQLPIEVVSNLVALFCIHLADAAFLIPANLSDFWFLLQEILSSSCCPSLLWLCIPDGPLWRPLLTVSSEY